MNATLTCTFENEYLQPLSKQEAHMVEQFLRCDAKTKKESILKINNLSASLQKLFKSDNLCLLSWDQEKGYFLTIAAPYRIEAGSLEAEAISILYQNATITSGYIIEIPYTSL